MNIDELNLPNYILYYDKEIGKVLVIDESYYRLTIDLIIESFNE